MKQEVFDIDIIQIYEDKLDCQYIVNQKCG